MYARVSGPIGRHWPANNRQEHTCNAMSMRRKNYYQMSCQPKRLPTCVQINKTRTTWKIQHLFNKNRTAQHDMENSWLPCNPKVASNPCNWLNTNSNSDGQANVMRQRPQRAKYTTGFTDRLMHQNHYKALQKEKMKPYVWKHTTGQSFMLTRSV